MGSAAEKETPLDFYRSLNLAREKLEGKNFWPREDWAKRETSRTTEEWDVWYWVKSLLPSLPGLLYPEKESINISVPWGTVCLIKILEDKFSAWMHSRNVDSYYLNISTNDSNLGILYMLTFIPPCSSQALSGNLEGVRNINLLLFLLRKVPFMIAVMYYRLWFKMYTLGQFYTGFSGVAVGIKSGENVVLYIIMLMINGLLDHILLHILRHWSSFSFLLKFVSWPFNLLLATFPELFINQHHWSDVVCHITLLKTHISKRWPDSALYTTHHHNISFTDGLNIININFLLVLGPEICFF